MLLKNLSTIVLKNDVKKVNKFLEASDFGLVSFQCIRKEFEHLYCRVLKKKTQNFRPKIHRETKIHWSRDWEYPWAVINSDVRKGDRVLDCGCGGSPLLPFLQRFGCEAYGIDPDIFKQVSLWGYYSDVIKRIRKRILPTKTSAGNYVETTNTNIELQSKPHSYAEFIKSGIKALIPPANNLLRYHKDPNKLGFKIKFSDDSLEKMHFPNNFFDKVFCISVIEHLPTEVAYRGMKEMARVLREDGLLIVTVDNDGTHVNPELVNSYDNLIDASGLKLYGESDFTMPDAEDVPGPYNVVGFILKK